MVIGDQNPDRLFHLSSTRGRPGARTA
jgi:hypothetical protein